MNNNDHNKDNVCETEQLEPQLDQTKLGYIFFKYAISHISHRSSQK